MDARAKTVREILHTGDQYIIPFFQRHYSWRRKHWAKLQSDLWTLLDDDDETSQHFLGPLVCTPLDHVPGEVTAYQLIDGQQRLTTLTLLLAAMRDLAREQGLDEFAAEITEDYLVHHRKKGLQRYKIVPRIGDREALLGVIEGNVGKEYRREAVVHAWQFFRKSIADWAAENSAAKLNKLFAAVTSRLSLVVITIAGENPYEIFESLNSTGLPLEESDLIRNFLFMQVPIGNQEDFHTEHWEPFERPFEESGDCPAINQTQFYRTYLMREGTYSKAKFTFVDFKEQNRRRSLLPQDQINELKRFAQYELQLRRPSTCGSAKLRNALDEIAMLDITTAHPLLMNLLDKQDAGKIDEQSLLGCIADLASFVIRRSICGESTRSYGKWFCEAIVAIKDHPRQDLQKYWLRRGWPDDAAMVSRLLEFPIYRREPKKCRLILERLESSYGHKEKVDASVLSIEHVMPQTIEQGKSAKAWKEMLGESWKAIHNRWLHTLGNLTLSGYNPDLGNRAFADKRPELLKSNLLLNKYFEKTSVWNEAAIKERGETIAAEVARLWPRPGGGDYIPPAVPQGAELTHEERKQLRLEYWTQFLDATHSGAGLSRLPKPSRRGWIGFPIGRSWFRLLAYLNFAKRYVGIALACSGTKAKEHFSLLRNDRAIVESTLGDDLMWLEQVHGTACHITKRLFNADPAELSDWHRQHAWLLNTLQSFRAIFSQRCKQLGLGDDVIEKRQPRRQRFWQTLLEMASKRTSLHSGVSPAKRHWIATGAGRTGLRYAYVIGKQSASVELYIDLGKGSKKKIKQIFDQLESRKAAIEAEVGQSLSWERLDSKRASRIAMRFNNGGLRSEEKDWPLIQERMIDCMIRLERALAPRIGELPC